MKTAMMMKKLSDVFADQQFTVDVSGSSVFFPSFFIIGFVLIRW